MSPHMTTKRRLRALLATAAIGPGAGHIVSAQRPAREFLWFAELVSADRAAKTVTVTARIESHVVRTLQQLTPGTPVALVRTQFKDAPLFRKAQN